jgi:hypothetical protein
MIKSSLVSWMAVGLFICTFVPAVAQEDEAEADDSKRCINARSIRGADVIDDNYVLFEIQGRRLFLNRLAKSCVGLSRDRRFSYDTYTRSLCARDKIRILKESGDGFYEGRSCSLGRFEPITYDELQVFLGERSAPIEPEKTAPAGIEDVTKGRRP